MKSVIDPVVVLLFVAVATSTSYAQTNTVASAQSDNQAAVSGQHAAQSKNARKLNTPPISLMCQQLQTDQELPAACQPPKDLQNSYCIDAASNYSDTTISVGHKNVIQFYLINKNPFLFNYTIAVSKTDFSEENAEALSAFTGEVGLSTAPAKPSTSLPSLGVTATPTVCQSRLQAIEARGRKISSDLSILGANTTVLTTTLQSKLGKINAGRLKSAGRQAAALCSDATALMGELDLQHTQLEEVTGATGAPQTASADDVLGTIQKQTAQLNLSLSQYKDMLESSLPCKDSDVCVDTREDSKKEKFEAASGCKTPDEFRIAMLSRHNDDSFLADATTGLTKVRDQVAQISTANCHIHAAHDQIASVLKNENSFFEKIGPYGPYSDSQDVTIAVSRSLNPPADDGCVATTVSNTPTAKQPAEKAEPGQGSSTPAPKPPKAAGNPVSNVVVHFGGGQRVYAGVGPAVSFLAVKEFQRAQGVTSGGTPATIIAYSTNGATRVAPIMGFLHVRPADSERLFITLGITAKNDNKGTAAEFLFGGSYGLLGNWLFLTGGAYLGQQQQLAGNLVVGQPVPTSLTGEIPVQKSYHWSGAFSINVRIPGLGTKSNTPKPQTSSGSKPPGTT